MRFLVFALLLLAPLSASAHVKYVLEEGVFENKAGLDWGFLFTGAFEAPQLIAALLTAIVLGSAIFLSAKLAWVRTHEIHIDKKIPEYVGYIPWMMRLALGIALVGSGIAGTMLTPAFGPTWPFLATLQVLVGFCLLAGFLIGPSAWAVIGLYLLALWQNEYAIGSLEFPALAFGILAFADPRPGVDDLLRIPFIAGLRRRELTPVLLRVGTGVSMSFLALYEKILNPHAAEQVVGLFHLDRFIPVTASSWVLGSGSVEFLIGILLVIGLRTRAVAAIATVVLTLTFFFFGEAVHAHVTLFAALSILFVTDGKPLARR